MMQNAGGFHAFCIFYAKMNMYTENEYCKMYTFCYRIEIVWVLFTITGFDLF